MDGGGPDDPVPRPPLDSLILGYGSMIPLPIAALIVWTTPPPWPTVVMWLAVWWAAVILVFIAGVRRGLSFHGEPAADRRDLAAMLWLFALGAGALAMPTLLLSLAMLVLGYLSVAILDPAAARRGAAPAHFERLRPRQMAVALIGLVGLLLYRIALATPF